MAVILADDISKCIFFNENLSISITISPKFVPKGPINNIPALVQIMAWRRPGDKPLSGPMMFIFLVHICGTRGRWVNDVPPYSKFSTACLCEFDSELKFKFIVHELRSYHVRAYERMNLHLADNT